MGGIDSTTSGILSAIGAPFFMALGFIIWDITWKKVGGSAFSLNLFKCNLASCGFLLACFVFGFEDTSTSVAPDDYSSNKNISVWTVQTIGFLTLSGAIGIVVGDLAWLQALHLLGATRVLVIDTIKPFSAAVMGWWLLGEDIEGVALVGIGLTAIGVLIVSFEKERDNGDGVGDSDEGDEVVRFQSQKEKGSDKDDGDYADEGRGKLDCHVDARKEQLQTDHHQKHDPNTPINGRAFKVDKVKDEVDKGKDEKGIKNMDGRSTNLNILKEGDNIGNNQHEQLRLRGYILAVGNVLLDTYGSVLTKQHGKGVSTWAINLIRFGSSGLFMLMISVAMRIHHYFKSSSSGGDRKEKNDQNSECRLPPDNIMVEAQGSQNPSASAITNPWYTLPNAGKNAWVKVSTGVLFVTFVCPALSNYALFKIALALAITLGSITPLYALLLEWLLANKRPTPRATIGATLAVAGVVFLSVWNI